MERPHQLGPPSTSLDTECIWRHFQYPHLHARDKGPTMGSPWGVKSIKLFYYSEPPAKLFEMQQMLPDVFTISTRSPTITSTFHTHVPHRQTRRHLLYGISLPSALPSNCIPNLRMSSSLLHILPPTSRSLLHILPPPFSTLASPFAQAPATSTPPSSSHMLLLDAYRYPAPS